LSANGLYLVHAFDFTGREPASWPKLTSGWHTGAPAAGDVDDDGLLETECPTRGGNSFLWDPPAPMCNTASTANLDGRDGAYNPQVNLHNNNRFGEDTVPPARLAPSDVVSTSRDLGSSTITITTSRIPGDDPSRRTPVRFT